MAQKVRFRLLADFKINLQEFPIYGESFPRFSRFALLSMARKIRCRFLADFKTNLQETPVQGGSFWRSLRFASVSQKNCSEFVDQICHYKALSQYSMALKIRFRLLTVFKKNLWETPIQGERFLTVSRLVSLSQKNGFLFVDQIWHYEALNQYSMAQNI